MKSKFYSKTKVNSWIVKVALNLFIVLFFIMKIQAQEERVDTNGIVMSKSKLVIEDFAYPLNLVNREQHSNFKFSYQVKPKFFVEIQGFYDTYLVSDIFKMSITAKFYSTEKLYLFSGVEIESESDKMLLNLPPAQLKIKNGMGYDVKQNFFLQVEHDLHFNKSNIGAYGTPSLFYLSGKYKF